MKEKKVKKVRKKIERKEKKSDNYEKQTKIAVIIMIVLIVSVLFSHWVIRASQKFEYNGIKFYKEKEGDIQYYKALLGFLSVNGENIPFILKLRNDPRKLEDIPFDREVKMGDLGKDVIISVSPKLGNCSDIHITLMDFAMTLKAFGIKATQGTTDENFSKEKEILFADCNIPKGKTVIVMETGEENKISITREPIEKLAITSTGGSLAGRDGGCYLLEVSDCRTQEVFERFIVEMIENSMVKV